MGTAIIEFEVELDLGRPGIVSRCGMLRGQCDICDGDIESICVSAEVRGDPDAHIDKNHWIYKPLWESIMRVYRDEIEDTVPRETSDFEEHSTLRLYGGHP